MNTPTYFYRPITLQHKVLFAIIYLLMGRAAEANEIQGTLTRANRTIYDLLENLEQQKFETEEQVTMHCTCPLKTSPSRTPP